MQRTAIEERVDREREAHTDRDVLAESTKLKNRFSHIWTFPSRQRFFALIESYLEQVDGKDLLDYGCGRGESSLKYLKRGARVYGIDISSAYIAQAEQSAHEAGFAEEQFDFRVMDAHKLEFEDSFFDIVVGFGILHHLDADTAMSEIYRVLKPGGRVLLQEPLADNPLLKVFRRLTPGARTEDEKPFSGRDIRRLSANENWKTELAYCGVFEAPMAVATSVIMPNRPDNFLLRWTDKLERLAHRASFLDSWNQYILFNMIKQA